MWPGARGQACPLCTTACGKCRGGTACVASVKGRDAGGRHIMAGRMSPPAPVPASPAPSSGALSAFLRGVERRGAVFAELQSGDPGRGDAALAAVMREFARNAHRLPFAGWARRFWTMLLAAPGLRGARMPPLPDGPLAVLSGLGPGPRAALLLRLVAGLSEDEAAAVLGIAPSTYRLALMHAFPRTPDGAPDPELWRAMREEAQRKVRELPQARLERIASLRDGTSPQAEKHRRREKGARARWMWPALVAVALLTAGALAATWWWTPAGPGPAPGGGAPGPVQGPGRIRTEELPQADAPPPGLGVEATLLTHPDLDLLLDQVAGEAPPADPAFDAWLVSVLEGEEGGATRR